MWIDEDSNQPSLLPKPVEVYGHKPLCAPSLRNQCRNQAPNIFQNIIELCWVQYSFASQTLNKIYNCETIKNRVKINNCENNKNISNKQQTQQSKKQQVDKPEKKVWKKEECKTSTI